MENLARSLTLNLGKIDARTLRFVLLLITLILFVLGAAAPGCPGDFSG